MAKIRQLPLQEIRKIAAGEVIDRPANIVKELIENAIDAGATAITVAITNGGKDSIQVIDNGFGMSPDDARICCDHHATSKIQCLDDLYTVGTFGFRGEALSSIAAVSTVTITTKETSAVAGTRITLTNGSIVEESEIAANTGTDILITGLFDAMPARKKFLKSRETEQRHIIALMHAVCYSHMALQVTFMIDGAVHYRCMPSADLRDRTTSLGDTELYAALLHISLEPANRGISLSGVLSHQHYGRYDRSGIMLFVRHRWVRNQQLVKAVIKGYANALPAGKFPAAILSITVDPQEIDVNIHPRKEEVKFLHPHIIESYIQKRVHETLEAHAKKLFAPATAASSMTTGDKAAVSDRAIEDNKATEATAEQLPSFDDYYVPVAPVKLGERAPVVLPRQYPPIHSISHALAQEWPLQQQACTNMQAPASHDGSLQGTIIGAHNKTYIVLSTQHGLLMVDQHAAHERIIYQRYLTAEQVLEYNKLVVPVPITVSPDKGMGLEELAVIIAPYGIAATVLNDQTIVITGTAPYLKNINIEELVREIIAVPYCAAGTLAVYKENICALMACKAAVKAGDSLSPELMRSLIQDLAVAPNSRTCPHGRPTYWLLEEHSIVQKFKRDYQTKRDINDIF